MATTLGEGAVKMAKLSLISCKQHRDLKGTNQKDRDLPSTQTAPPSSSVVIGQRSEGNMSLQLQAPEYSTDFAVEMELVGTGLSCLCKARPSFFPVSHLSTVWTGSWHWMWWRAGFFPTQWPALPYLKQVLGRGSSVPITFSRVLPGTSRSLYHEKPFY